MKNILRWIVFLPGAYILGFLATFPLHWSLYYSLTRFIEPYPEFPERCLSPLLFSLVVQISATWIVPTYKKQISILILILHSIIYFFSIVLWVSNNQLVNLGNVYISFNIYTIFGIIGMIIGFIINYTKYIKKDIESSIQ